MCKLLSGATFEDRDVCCCITEEHAQWPTDPATLWISIDVDRLPLTVNNQVTFNGWFQR